MVCVSPGMFDTNVMVAPNSPSALAKHSTRPAMMPGGASGGGAAAKARKRMAARVEAAASSFASTASIERRIARTSNGNPMMPQASGAGPAERKHDADVGEE